MYKGRIGITYQKEENTPENLVYKSVRYTSVCLYVLFNQISISYAPNEVLNLI